MRQNYLYYKAINWNDIEDELDNAVWEKLTSLFWLDTRIHIEEDKEQWESLSNVEQEQLNRLLVLLTNLATYQSMEAGEIIRQSERSQQEIAIINNLQFTEMVNTKAYNRILQVFNDNKNLQEWFDWVDNDEQVLNYLQEIDTIYQSTAATRKRFMSLCVEGLMNIAYLSYPIQLSIEKSFINMGQMLDMVIQNEAVHCYYLNHKVKLLLREMSQKEVSVFREWAVQTVDKLTRIAIQMIIKYYQDERSPEIAINLVKQEANHILASVELEDIYQVDSEKIAIINAKLNRLRQLNLQNSGVKVSNVMIDRMTEEDYDFQEDAMLHKTMNWQIDEDELDEYVWDKATAQFWLDTRVPVSNDLLDWKQLSDIEKRVVKKAVGGLALLDTLQSEEGLYSIKKGARTQKELAVLSDFTFMESIHAKTYGTILISLNTFKDIEELYDWMNNDPRMQFKAQKVNEVYQSGTPMQVKVASVFLEGILYYSNFFIPLWYRGQNKLANLAELIKLVIRDESVHGTYLGYKFRQDFDALSSAEQEAFLDWMYTYLDELLENEFAYTEEVYSEIGLADDIKTFVKYNANKSLQNMGFGIYFEEATANAVNPIVMNGISIETANHDFFSQVGAGYLMGEAEAMTDDDYDF